MGKTHHKFRSIGQLKNASHLARKDATLHSLVYRAKQKLHGTNGAIVIEPDGAVYAQSRNRVLGIESDNYGFAAWVEKNKESFSQLAMKDVTSIIYGEWAGKGVQEAVAVSKLDRQFFVFEVVHISRFGTRHECEPVAISNFIYLHGPMPGDLHVLPWSNDREYIAVFDNDEEAAKFQGFMEQLVEGVDELDPYIRATFGITGTGEGYVMYPVRGQRGTPAFLEQYNNLLDFTFKIKGEKHKMCKGKQKVQLTPEHFVMAREFAISFVTEERCKQAMHELDISAEKPRERTGDFIGWVCRDCIKEGSLELSLAGLDAKKVGGAVATRAREWYHA